jgi:radical SAM protein with 4Fe4S-binding SPASM domain
MTELGKRPRKLALIGNGLPARLGDAPAAPRRNLPLLPSSRDVDVAATPNYVVWELTLKCDLSCRHCGSRAGKARDNELSTTEALNLARQLVEMGTREVTLIGGEAYLHEGWLDIADYLAKNNIRVGVLTGGRGLTREKVQQARESGIATISVSVDALESMHDTLRGHVGSYKLALQAIEHVRAAGLQVAANTQIARPALRDIEPLFDILCAAGVEAWQVSMTVPMGRAADEPGLLLQPYQVLEVLPMLARLDTLGKARGVRVYPGNDIGYFGPYESQLRANNRGGYRGTCSAGREGMGIEADGAVKGCPSLPSREYVGGSIRDASLRDIWERAEPLQFTRNRTKASLWGFCADCYYAEACMGGCSWTAHTLFGKLGNNPYCHHRALELLEVGKRERIVQIARAEGRPFDTGLFDCIEEAWPAGEIERARALAETGLGYLDH